MRFLRMLPCGNAIAPLQTNTIPVIGVQYDTLTVMRFLRMLPCGNAIAPLQTNTDILTPDS
jgi:hypothetical protein